MNRLITVEGLPCSGKSTTAKHIAESIKANFYDEGCGDHPADHEFHAFIKSAELSTFSSKEQALIKQNSVQRTDGYIVPLGEFGGELFDRLLQYKIYDFLPWETESPVMLDKWREFVRTAEPHERYVFNCVLLQNPMCETMMRFGFDTKTSTEYISSICEIIAPLEPFVVYLYSGDIRKSIEKAVPERGSAWLNGVIDYHCNGAYGKAMRLSGFDGYISALEERQRREIEILRSLNVRRTIVNDPQNDWDKAYTEIDREISSITSISQK